ncbi:MAG: hypothetical protein ACUVSX_08285 [Aggregatilineales bacterium]
MSDVHHARARAVFDAVAADAHRANGPILRRVVLTVVPPFAVFALSGAASSALRTHFAAQFGDEGLNTLTFISTTLLTLALTWWAWQFCERRFGGLRALRLMFEVLRGMSALETGLKAAERGQQLPLDEAAAGTAAAWARLLDHLGLPPAKRL